jgi:hypothetical protein
MTQVESSLQTLAEVSVALAGFASLLVVLRRGSAAEVSQGEGADLFVVVGGNLLVLVFSLLPLALYQLGVSETSTFRFASVLLAAAVMGGYVAILRLRASLLASGVQPWFPLVSQVSVHTPLGLAALLLTISADLFGETSAGAYLLALLMLVSLASLPLLFVVIELAIAPKR